MMSREAIRLELAPKDGNWGFNVSELEAMLPAGTVDTTVERVYQEVCMTLTYFLFFFCFIIEIFLVTITVYAFVSTNNIICTEMDSLLEV